MVDQPVVLWSDQTDQTADHQTDEERDGAVPEVGKVVKAQMDKLSFRRDVGVDWPGNGVDCCQVGPAAAAVLDGAGH